MTAIGIDQSTQDPGQVRPVDDPPTHEEWAALLFTVLEDQTERRYKECHPDDDRPMRVRVEAAWGAHFRDDDPENFFDLEECPCCGGAPVPDQSFWAPGPCCCRPNTLVRETLCDRERKLRERDEADWNSWANAAGSWLDAALELGMLDDDVCDPEALEEVGSTSFEDLLFAAWQRPMPTCQGARCFSNVKFDWHAWTTCPAFSEERQALRNVNQYKLNLPDWDVPVYLRRLDELDLPIDDLMVDGSPYVFRVRHPDDVWRARRHWKLLARSSADGPGSEFSE